MGVRPIDANALIALFEAARNHPDNILRDLVFLDGVLALVDGAPTLDVVHVEHIDNTTLVHAKNVDEWKERIILCESESKNCAVYHQETDASEAYWIHCKGKTNLWYCSACGCKMIYNPTRRTYNIEKKTMSELNKFCRNCGARMDGDKR